VVVASELMDDIDRQISETRRAVYRLFIKLARKGLDPFGIAVTTMWSGVLLLMKVVDRDEVVATLRDMADELEADAGDIEPLSSGAHH
jgi:hypothetical protein